MGRWVITSTERLEFTIVCESNVQQPHALIINPPLDVIELDSGCSASNDHLTLLPYYHNASKYIASNVFLRLVRQMNISQLLLLEPFRTKLQNLTFTKLPERLQNMASIPIDQLVHQLQTIDTEVEGGTKSYWEYLIYVILIILALVGVNVGYSKLLKPWLAKRIKRGKRTLVTTEIELVPVEAGGAVTTDRELMASTPLGSRRKEADVPQSAVRHIYPSLDVTANGQQ